MRSHVTKSVIVGLACVVFLFLSTPAALGEIHVFWKTHQCPTVEDLNPPIVMEYGYMQAPVGKIDPSDPDTAITSVGGPFCYCTDCGEGPDDPVNRQKGRNVYNANVVFNDGGTGQYENWLYKCVVCWYDDRTSIKAIPTLSALGTAILLGGLMTAAIYRLRRKQNEVPA